jgi:DNA-directed RNA polymerase subunit M/transcription elongation factor TFIIS
MSTVITAPLTKKNLLLKKNVVIEVNQLSPLPPSLSLSQSSNTLEISESGLQGPVVKQVKKPSLLLNIRKQPAANLTEDQKSDTEKHGYTNIVDEERGTSHKKRDLVLNKLLNIAELKPHKDLVERSEMALYRMLRRKRRGDFPDHDFEKAYTDHGLTMIRNLDPNSSVSSTWLLNKLIDGEITPEKMVEMDRKDFCPDKWEKIKDERRKEIKMVSENKEVTTDMYKCRKCGNKKCTYYQLQIRSIDEPMTTFITCIVCGKKWNE